MRLVFTDQYTNILLLMNGLILLIFMYGYRKKKQRTMKFGNYETLQKVTGGNIIRADLLLAITRVIAISSLLIGLSSPVLVQTVQGADHDFVVTLDTSASMFTADVEPNRFEAAKDISRTFVGELGNSSQVGLISYSGDVIEEQELTSDMGAVRSGISNIEMGEVAGTATGDAVASSASMLMSSEEENRSIILVTDGTNNRGQSIEEAAGFAARQNVTVNPIGIGESGRNNTEDEVIRGEEATRAQFPNLNQEELMLLANETGGEASFVTSREGLETAFVDLEDQETENDVSRYFILLAGILLILDAVYRSTDLEIIP